MWMSENCSQKSISDQKSTNARIRPREPTSFAGFGKSLLMTKSTHEAFEENFQISEVGQIPRKKFKKPDDLIHRVISKWQLYNSERCVQENALNAVLESMYINSYIDEEHSSNSLTSNIVFENEAVLTAIEWKGLKQSNSSKGGVNHCYESRYTVSKDCKDILQRQCYPYHNVQREYVIGKHELKSQPSSGEIQENNFEIDFMAEAVSAAIEVKGLTRMHHM